MIHATIKDDRIEAFSEKSYKVGDWEIFMEGSIFNYTAFKMDSGLCGSDGIPLPQEPESDVQVVAERFNRDFLKSLSNYDGDFAIVAINHRDSTLHAVSDSFGTRPLFFRVSPHVSIGTDYAKVVAEAPVAENMAYRQLKKILPFIPNDETSVIQVNRARPMSYMFFNKSGDLLFAGPYMAFSHKDEKIDTIKALKDSVRRRVRNAKHICVNVSKNDAGRILWGAARLVAHELGDIPITKHDGLHHATEEGVVNVRAGVSDAFFTSRTEVEAHVRAPLNVLDDRARYPEALYPLLYPPFVNAILSKDQQGRRINKNNLHKAFKATK